MQVDRFIGKYAFLSNFYIQKITYNNVTYKSNLNAFLAQFFNETQQKLMANCTPQQALTIYNTKKHNELSMEEQLNIMTEINTIKFQDKSLLEQLLSTGEMELLNITNYNNPIWGLNIVNGLLTGENQLGKILMNIRNNHLSNKENDIQEIIDTSTEPSSETIEENNSTDTKKKRKSKNGKSEENNNI